MTQNDCPFCSSSDLKIVAENNLALAIRDKYPVKPLHSLLITKRHCTNIFETTAEEREALHQLAVQVKKDIGELDSSVEGFNFGSNISEVAGQKIFHTHVHLIPRRRGDLDPPPAAMDSPTRLPERPVIADKLIKRFDRGNTVYSFVFCTQLNFIEQCFCPEFRGQF